MQLLESIPQLSEEERTIVITRFFAAPQKNVRGYGSVDGGRQTFDRLEEFLKKNGARA
jgi:hypothetical protein